MSRWLRGVPERLPDEPGLCALHLASAAGASKGTVGIVVSARFSYGGGHFSAAEAADVLNPEGRRHGHLDMPPSRVLSHAPTHNPRTYHIHIHTTYRSYRSRYICIEHMHVHVHVHITSVHAHVHAHVHVFKHNSLSMPGGGRTAHPAASGAATAGNRVMSPRTSRI